MKILVNIVAFLFITFLSTPTIISMIDKDVDTSYFYNMCEEEENHVPFNEIKSLPSADFSFTNFSSDNLFTLNVSIEHDLSFDNLAHQIFSPPPELI
ncbi:hypothetical protein [Flavobacterium celericrescens]|uniref:Uncharacterized protein n=1 Tax=Flavobacterium celericrescens TaxID=2709780 RepID=A0ABX0ID02_9FLAO|nr:hypothetical protein [Flavobacterium celericrescens]NHM04183.1 hypothetical protein [Flavobacterium celericrescens]